MVMMMQERTLLPDEATTYDKLEELLNSGRVFLSSTSDEDNHVPLPDNVLSVLTEVIQTLHKGVAIVVLPRPTRLTTQQAAEALGVSRPTLVKLLESGDIPHERPSSHRYVQLSDLLTYQEGLRQRRRELSTQMAEEAAERLDRAPDRMVPTR